MRNKKLMAVGFLSACHHGGHHGAHTVRGKASRTEASQFSRSRLKDIIHACSTAMNHASVNKLCAVLRGRQR
jgi:Spy/CpxP family protein refolding chaperone